MRVPMTHQCRDTVPVPSMGTPAVCTRQDGWFCEKWWEGVRYSQRLYKVLDFHLHSIIPGELEIFWRMRHVSNVGQSVFEVVPLKFYQSKTDPPISKKSDFQPKVCKCLLWHLHIVQWTNENHHYFKEKKQSFKNNTPHVFITSRYLHTFTLNEGLLKTRFNWLHITHTLTTPRLLWTFHLMITDATVGGKFLLTSDLCAAGNKSKIFDLKLYGINQSDHWITQNDLRLQINLSCSKTIGNFLFFIFNEQDSVAAIECEQTTVANENNAL